MVGVTAAETVEDRACLALSQPVTAPTHRLCSEACAGIVLTRAPPDRGMDATGTGPTLPPLMFRSNRSRAILALLVASFVFGATFVVVKSAVSEVPPLTFVAWRFLLGALLLSIFAFPRGRRIWWHGTLAGLALFGGYAFQTVGLTETSASNSALITGLYVVITPFLAALFARRPPSWWSVGAAALSFGGLILITGADGPRLRAR